MRYSNRSETRYNGIKHYNFFHRRRDSNSITSCITILKRESLKLRSEIHSSFNLHLFLRPNSYRLLAGGFCSRYLEERTLLCLIESPTHTSALVCTIEKWRTGFSIFIWRQRLTSPHLDSMDTNTICMIVYKFCKYSVAFWVDILPLNLQVYAWELGNV